MAVLGLVPMKGHSERVPGKNLRLIAGRPLFHWVVQTLLDARLISSVMVDTDSPEIEAAVASAFPSVLLHRRRPELHGDDVPMHAIVADIAVDSGYEAILQTHSTNPLLRPGTVDAAIAAFDARTEHDSLMGVTAIQSRFFFPDGRPVNHDPAVLVKTQDLEPLLEENSNLYLAPREQIIASGMRIGEKPILFEIDPAEAVDIDVELDFKFAEMLLTQR